VSDRRPPALPPPLVVIVNLEPELLAARSAQLLSKVPWDGPRLDPDVLVTKVMLDWLR
jgi:hypothetical protein